MSEEEKLRVQAVLVEMQDRYYELGFNAAIEKAARLLYELNNNNLKEYGRNCLMINVPAFKEAMKGGNDD